MMESLAKSVSSSCRGVCLNINLRGVGKSGGISTITLVEEIEDVKSSVVFLRQQFPNLSNNLYLIGYSAGACVCGSASDLCQPRGTICIGYPCSNLSKIIFKTHLESLSKSNNPFLFISGARDFFYSSHILEKYINRESVIQIIDGAGHFDILVGNHTKEVLAALRDFVHK